MSIYLRCCGKDHVSGKRKCSVCGKSFTKYVVRVKDSTTGKWRTKTVYSFKHAKELETKFKTDAIEDRFFDKKQAGSIDFEKYIEYAKVHKKTWDTDQSRWKIHIKDKDYLTQSGITKILVSMKEDGFAPATIDHVYKLIRHVFNWHIHNGYYFQPNPCRTIKPPKYDNRITNYLSQDEVKELLDHLDGWDNRRAAYLIAFAVYTGRRKSEITNLTWNDVDLTDKTITCRNTKNGRNLSFPLNQKAYYIIQKAHEIKISDNVFPSSTGKNYYCGFNLAWTRLKRRIGLTIRFHDLRHTYASHLASSGKVDIYTLKTLLGHQEISLTMRYAHLTDQAVKQATNIIDEIF